MISFDPNKMYAELMQAGEEWADLEAAANVMEDTRHAVLARLMLASNAPSVAAREVEARASKEYESHVIKTQDARAKALKAKVRYESAKALADFRRTQAANDRALMKL